MILQSIIDIIESVAPRDKQEEWDNSGLQVGDTSAEISAALLTTDITEAVVNEAISLGCNLIISHHPLIFHPLRHLTGQSQTERCVETCIRHHIAVYSAHTTMDKFLHGVSGRMAEKMGITDYDIMFPDAEGYGLGVVGNLPEALTPEEFLLQLQAAFNAPWLRYTNSPKEKIQKAAFCGGAGGDMTYLAVQCGADVYVSADFRYHQFQEFANDIMVVDMDHWVSEHFTRDIFAELLAGKVRTFIAKSDKSPIQIV